MKVYIKQDGTSVDVQLRDVSGDRWVLVNQVIELLLESSFVEDIHPLQLRDLTKCERCGVQALEGIPCWSCDLGVRPSDDDTRCNTCDGIGIKDNKPCESCCGPRDPGICDKCNGTGMDKTKGTTCLHPYFREPFKTRAAWGSLQHMFRLIMKALKP